MSNREQIGIKRDTFVALQALAQQQRVETDELAEEAMEQGLGVIRQRLFFKERALKAEARGTTLEDALSVLERAGDERSVLCDALPTGISSAANSFRD